MKSKMTWKPPPIFGGNNNCNHDCNNNMEGSIVAKKMVVKNNATSAVMMGNDLHNPPHRNDTRAPTIRGRQQSIAWKPPPFFTRYPSTIAEKEEGKDENIEDMLSDNNICHDEASKTIATPNVNGLVEMEEQFVTIADEDQKRTRKIIVETFRPFRNEIASYVAKKFKENNDANSNRERYQSKKDEVEGEESTIKILMTAMEDDSTDHKDDFPRMEVPRKSIKVRELFSFLEGARVSIRASTRLVDISRQQVHQKGSYSFPSSLLPPHIAQTPRKFRSIRAISIARTMKQCEADKSSNDHGVFMIEEKGDESAPGPTNKQPRKFQSLRAMSIARIRRETNASTDDTTSGSTKLVTNNTRDSTRGDANDIKKLLLELEEAEKYQLRLEQQLKKAGVVIAEDIPYGLARQKVAEIAGKMSELHDKSHGACISEKNKIDKEAEYFKLEQEMEKYITALEFTEEWIEEQAEGERKWEEAMEVDNKIALKMVLRHMPVDVRNRSELQLKENPTPNGKILPRSMAQKFKRTNCLQLLRTDLKEMIKWHPSMFENLRVTGLTLTERRALYQHLKTIGIRWKEQSTGGGDKMLKRKLVWFETLKSNFRECLCAYERHIDMYGPPGNHPYAISLGIKGCPMIGKQCLLRADIIMDYSGNYGYPEDSVYFKQTNDDPSQSNSESGEKRINGKIPTKTRGLVSGIQGRECGPGRGGLLYAIKGHGCGRGDHGRGGLSDATKAPGRVRTGGIKGRGGSGRGPDRGGLLNEMKDRGGDCGRVCGRAHAGRDTGGRGGILAAIQARKTG